MRAQTPDHRGLHLSIVWFVQPNHVFCDFVHKFSAASSGLSCCDQLVTEAT
jgi:hypothetical protein